MVGLRRANGQIVQLGDPVPTAELHNLRHVVEQQEWPLGTTQAQYEQSLRDLALDLRVGILVSERSLFGWQVAIIGRTGTMRGPGGRDRVVVEYRVGDRVLGDRLPAQRGPPVRSNKAEKAMAASSNLSLVNDITLRSVGLMLEDIHDRAPDWNERPEDERSDFHLEWEGLVGRLEGTVEDDAAGILTTEQRDRLRELARELVKSRKTIMRVGLDYPDLGHLLAEMTLSPDDRLAHDINSLLHWAGRLRMMGDFWESPLLDAREKQAFPADWDNVIGRFAKVEAAARRGELEPASREELRRVAEWLDELLLTMRRLGVRLPDLEALERARSVEAA